MHHPPTRLPEQFPSEPAGAGKGGRGGETWRGGPSREPPCSKLRRKGAFRKSKSRRWTCSQRHFEKGAVVNKRGKPRPVEAEKEKDREGGRAVQGEEKGRQRARKLRNVPQRPPSAWSRQGTVAPASSGPQGQSYSDEVRSTL